MCELAQSAFDIWQAGARAKIAGGDFFGRIHEGIELAKDESFAAPKCRKERQQRYAGQKTKIMPHVPVCLGKSNLFGNGYKKIHCFRAKADRCESEYGLNAVRPDSLGNPLTLVQDLADNGRLGYRFTNEGLLIGKVRQDPAFAVQNSASRALRQIGFC